MRLDRAREDERLCAFFIVRGGLDRFVAHCNYQIKRCTRKGAEGVAEACGGSMDSANMLVLGKCWDQYCSIGSERQWAGRHKNMCTWNDTSYSWKDSLKLRG